jgi:hypothetical protein
MQRGERSRPQEQREHTKKRRRCAVRAARRSRMRRFRHTCHAGGRFWRARGELPRQTTARGHKTDTSETTRATSRDASVAFLCRRFAAETVSQMTACDGKEGVDGSSPSEGFDKGPANRGSWFSDMTPAPCGRTLFGHGLFALTLETGTTFALFRALPVHRTAGRSGGTARGPAPGGVTPGMDRGSRSRSRTSSPARSPRMSAPWG